MNCTVFIDESGDTGISIIRADGKPGSSDYFTMGAAVLQRASQIRARKMLDQLQDEFGKTKRWKHATDLNHIQRLRFCQEISKLHIRLFGVISYKPTLGAYSEQIGWRPEEFYNKCSKYLLEIIGRYLAAVSPELKEPQIVFEKRNHDYDKMLRYLGRVKETPIYPQSKALVAINPFGITKKTKSEEDLLRVADMVSYALYSCVNKTPDNFGITESRYLVDLSNRFASDKKGQVLGTGIKCIHKLSDLCLDKSVEQTILKMRAKPMP